MVLIDTMSSMSRALPRSAEGASLDRSDLFKRLPPIFVAWFTLVLEPHLRQENLKRNVCEGRTLSELMDCLLTGDIMQAMMIILGRLKALTQASMPDGGGWQMARHHEMVQPDPFGILTRQDRANAARDQREEQRTHPQPQAKGTGNRRGKGSKGDDGG